MTIYVLVNFQFILMLLNDNDITLLDSEGRCLSGQPVDF